MRALTLLADRKLELREVAPPPPPAAGEVQIRVKAVALNHIDVWGWRGMAFAKRTLPLIVGAEAAGEVAAVGPDVTAFQRGDRVVMYSALTCGACRACREGRDNLCENVGGVMGFHIDGFARLGVCAVAESDSAWQYGLPWCSGVVSSVRCRSGRAGR